MRKCLNHHMLRGFVGKDPDCKELRGGGYVARFSVATTVNWKDKKDGEWKKKTEWHQIEAWDRLAERAQKWISKGDFVNVEGLVEHRKWTKGGQENQMTVIKATDLSCCDKKPWPNQRGSNSATDSETDFANDGADEAGDMPY